MSSPFPKLALYHFEGCYFCGLVRESAEELDVPLELRDIDERGEYLSELMAVRGGRTVPVLRIEQPDGKVDWLPESSDIVRHLRELVGRPDPLPRWLDGVRTALRRVPWLLLLAGLLTSGRARPLLLVAGLTLIGIRGITRRRRRPRVFGAIALAAAVIVLGVTVFLRAR